VSSLHGAGRTQAQPLAVWFLPFLLPDAGGCDDAGGIPAFGYAVELGTRSVLQRERMFSKGMNSSNFSRKK
jgi:hypothetical protein